MPENYVEYNNNKRPWTINASKIYSDKSLYEQDYPNISGLILEASNNNIDIKTNNGITKFHNDVSFIGEVSSNILNSNILNSNTFNSNSINVTDKITLLKNNTTSNIDGNIFLNGNFTLNGQLNIETLTQSERSNFSNSIILNSRIGIDSSGNYQDIIGNLYSDNAAFVDVSLNNLEVSNNIVSYNLLLKNKENNLININNNNIIAFQINNIDSYLYNNNNDENNINTNFSNQSFLLKKGLNYTFKFKHRDNFFIEISYNSIFNDYILNNTISNTSNLSEFSTLVFTLKRNFQNMNLIIIIKDTNNNITDTIEFKNFFVFEYNINTIEKFTDIDNSINNLLINTQDQINGSITNNSITSNSVTSNSLNITNSIKIENNDGKMKLIFY
jgi:hypothetical protein